MHRDIKPANAILSDAGELKLVDFGLAKLLDDSGDERLPLPKGGGPSGLDGFLGTPAYMAPEIWRGEPSTFRSDIYSAGALLYHLCAGRPPHVASTLADLGVAVLSGAPGRLDAESGVDPALAAVIARCLEPDPRARFGHGGELREALELLAPDRRARAVPDGNPYRGLQSFQPEHRVRLLRPRRRGARGARPPPHRAVRARRRDVGCRQVLALPRRRPPARAGRSPRGRHPLDGRHPHPRAAPGARARGRALAAPRRGRGHARGAAFRSSGRRSRARCGASTARARGWSCSSISSRS